MNNVIYRGNRNYMDYKKYFREHKVITLFFFIILNEFLSVIDQHNNTFIILHYFVYNKKRKKKLALLFAINLLTSLPQGAVTDTN